MSTDLMSEILSAHADELNSGGQIRKETYLRAFPGESGELESLLDVAARVKRVLKPVQLEPVFRARLRNGLIMAAHHQQAQRIFVEKHGEPQWGWLLGAAAIGSAAGLIAVVWRSRSERGQESRVAAVVTRE